jgi:hypothetical protein
MGWQAEVFARLRDREWHVLGELFERFAPQIEFHFAMRAAMRGGQKELPPIPKAKWKKFCLCINTIGVESDGDPRRRKWRDRIRLTYVEGRICAQCGGPVIKASWAARPELPNHKVICLSCPEPKKARRRPPRSRPAALPPAPAPPPALPLTLSVVAKAKAHRAIARVIRDRHRVRLSLNEIERQLQHWSPDVIVSRYYQSLALRPRPPPQMIAP